MTPKTTLVRWTPGLAIDPKVIEENDWLSSILLPHKYPCINRKYWTLVIIGAKAGFTVAMEFRWENCFIVFPKGQEFMKDF